MLTASGAQWWLELLKFAFAVFIAFFIPGNTILPSKVKKSLLSNITLSIITGMVLFTWQEFTFGYLSLRNLTYFYIFLFSAIWILKIRKQLSFSQLLLIVKPHLTINILLIFLIILGVISQTLPLYYNGVYLKDKGLIFTGGDTEDNLWHASLTYEISQRFPPFAPGQTKVIMKNYHYWSNLVIASFIRVFRFPLFPIQFHFFPLLVSLLLGLTTITFAQTLKFGKKITNLAVFFNYFGGDLIYFFLIVFNRQGKFFVMSSLEDSTKFLYNPPRAFSYVIALGGLSLFLLWRKQLKNFRLGFLSMFLLASTVGFKIYTALFFISGIGILYLIALLKRNWAELKILSIFFILSALIYLPTNSGAGGLIWAPFSIVNNFIVQPALGLERWEMARLIFLADKKYLHNFVFETLFTLLFLVGILGTKFVGFFSSPHFMVKKLGKDLAILLYSGIFISLFGGLFFVQSTGGANTFNFLVSVFFFASFLSSLSIVWWQQHLPKLLFSSLLVFLILITVPRFIYETALNFKNFLNPKGSWVTNEEIELYDAINKDSGFLFTVGVDPSHYLGRNTPYVSLFLKQPLLVSGNGLLKNFGLDISQQERTQRLIYNTNEEKIIITELLTNQVKYIVLYENHNLQATESAYFTFPIIKNNAGKVLEVNRASLIKRAKTLFDKKSLKDLNIEL